MTSLYLPKENITLHVGDEISFCGRKGKRSVIEQKSLVIERFLRCASKGQKCSDCETDGWYAVGAPATRGAYCPTYYNIILTSPLIRINKVTEV